MSPHILRPFKNMWKTEIGVSFLSHYICGCVNDLAIISEKVCGSHITRKKDKKMRQTGSDKKERNGKVMI